MGADHPDIPGASYPRCRARARLDDADDRKVVLVAQSRQCVRRSGIARNDDSLDSLIAQKGRDLPAVANHRLGTLGPVRDSRGIAEINDALVRQLSRQLSDNGESANPGIKDANGRRSARVSHHAMYAATRIPRPTEVTPTLVLKSARFAATQASAPEKR